MYFQLAKTIPEAIITIIDSKKQGLVCKLNVQASANIEEIEWQANFGTHLVLLFVLYAVLDRGLFDITVDLYCRTVLSVTESTVAYCCKMERYPTTARTTMMYVIP